MYYTIFVIRFACTTDVLIVTELAQDCSALTSQLLHNWVPVGVGELVVGRECPPHRPLQLGGDSMWAAYLGTRHPAYPAYPAYPPPKPWSVAQIQSSKKIFFFLVGGFRV